MRFYMFRDWLFKQIGVNIRLQVICMWYLISLMVITRKHSLDHASFISGKNKSQFSRLLQDHPGTAVYTLDNLSKKQARQFSKAMTTLKSLPWKVAIIIDLTDQRRSSLKSENVQKLNHGKGYFVGHQWTNIVLLMGSHIIPLPPIAFMSRKYCRKHGIEYKTEHKRVIEYLETMKLEEYVEGLKKGDVVVLADSGYDDKRIQKVIVDKGWDFVMALKKKRSVKSVAQKAKTTPSRGWSQIGAFFKAHRRLKWETARIPSGGPKEKRKDFRIRHTRGWLKGVGLVHLVCSEKSSAPRGERKYFACTNLTIKPGQILIAYRLRWSIELFHKSVKMHLGFGDVSAMTFDAVKAHVHWVYCAYILLQGGLPKMPSSVKSLPERQRYVMSILENKEKANLLQRLTQIGGVGKQKNELKRALVA